MKKISLLLAAVLMIAVMLCGCGKNSEPVDVTGKWEFSHEGVGYTVTFSDNGFGLAESMGGFFNAEFTYTVEDNELTITPAKDHSNILPFDSGELSSKGDTIAIESDDTMFYLEHK